MIKENNIYNIEIIFNNYFNCEESAWISILNWHNIPYEPIFAYSWFFKLKIFGINLSLSIDAGLSNIYKALKRYYNITITNYITTKKNALNVIEKNLKENQPILFKTNLYWCPWCSRYKKSWFPHAVMIVGIDFKKKILNCLDSEIWRLNKTPACLPFEDFFKGYKSIHSMNLQNIKIENNWIDMLISSISNMNRKLINNDITYNKRVHDKTSLASFLKKEIEYYLSDLFCLAEKIKKRDNVKDEKIITLLHKNIHFIDMPLFRMFCFIINARGKFSLFLKYLAQQNNIPELIYFSTELYNISQMWVKNTIPYIQQILEKNMYSDRKIIESLSDKLYEVIQYEKNVLENFIKFILLHKNFIN